ncbi:MAG: mechanosensitive ion channel [Leptolyngbyaceae cyanobacterium bins.349]|nr:mechanosensitive ion channel [Leptolyngbyaceae cyanobacterium bins.349]
MMRYLFLSWLIGVTVSLSAIAPGQTQELEGSLGWKPYGLIGDVAYAPVRLDGHDLFSIAAERQTEKGDQWGLGSLQIRRNLIESRLKAQVRSLVENRIPPESVQVVTTQFNKQPAVQVIINGTPMKPILTVTSLDAEIYGLTEPELAEDYARKIQQGLVRAIEERQPANLRSQAQAAAIGGAISVLIIAILIWIQRQLHIVRRQLRQDYRRQQDRFSQQQLREDELNPSSTISEQQLFDLKRRSDRKTWQKRIVQLLVVMVGGFAIAWILQRFPQTRGAGILLFRQPVALLLIGLLTAIAIIGSHLLIDRGLARWAQADFSTSPTQINRRQQRLLTLSPIWKQVTTIFLVILGLVLAYASLSLSTGLTLFTEIGVFGLAISLAFQSAIKDILAGWMLLAQDAFAIGDLVAVKEMAGVVEDMSLSMTHLRSSAGELISLRNGEITSVSNRSKEWSRMDFTVLVDYETDVKQALSVLRSVFQTMQSDPVWGTQLISDPDILGIEQFDLNGLLLKIRVQTQAGQQFNVTREFRLRLTQAFKDAGIKPAISKQEVRMRNSAEK